MSYDNTGIPVATQFNLKSPSPIDSRYVIENQSQLESLLSENAIYPGLSFALMGSATIGDTTYEPGIYRVDTDITIIRRIDEIDVTAIDSEEINALFEEVE